MVAPSPVEMSPYFELLSDSETPVDPAAVVTRRIEGGAGALLIDRRAVPPGSSGDR